MDPTPLQDIVDGVMAWVVDVLSEADVPLAGSYDFDTGFKDGGLPDVVMEAASDETFDVAPPEFSFLRMQQVSTRVVTIETSIMAEVTDLEDIEAHRAAALRLRDYADRLQLAKIKDGTLGQRVKHTASTHRFEFRPSFVAFEDGTRGREMRFTFQVGEPVSA